MKTNLTQIDPVERAIVVLLSEERIKQRLTYSELAEKTHASRSTLNHTELGKTRPGFWLIREMCEGLSLNMEDLVRQAYIKAGIKKTS